MSVPAGTVLMDAPKSLSSKTLPFSRYSGSSLPVRCSRIISQRNLILAHIAAVCLTWFDCVAPCVMTVSALFCKASPIRNSSLRVLFPPVARPVQSSRLI